MRAKEADQQTLYQVADAEIRRCIEVYLTLAEESVGLTAVKATHLLDRRAQVILLAGIGLSASDKTPDEVVLEWQRRQAIRFDLETGITAGVYANLRSVAERFYDQVRSATRDFLEFTPDFLTNNPHLLPVIQHLAGIFSKSKLKTLVGSVSDVKISGPAAQRLAALLPSRIDSRSVNKGEVLRRLESTLEGIVRDLVGRVLLESIVDAALRRRSVAYQREAEFKLLPGVVYDFRPDFVIPTAREAVCFIEVRKSSSRHASLYAKDKMFSAINWKGKNAQLLAVLVVDGEWTKEILRVLANVFDYVVPITRVDELVATIDAYVRGDRTKLKWLIDFKITAA